MNEKWVRKCPKCNGDIVYRHASSFYNAKSNMYNCRNCSNKLNSDKYDYKNKFSGNNNPFYGKKHTDETKSIISKTHKGIKQTGNTLQKSRRSIKIAKASQNGKGLYDLWINKYGLDIADQKMQEYKKKQSILNAGINNNMYGKPAPNGSGNGWKSWYKGIHFKSLRELQFYIDSTELQNKICNNIHMKKEFRVKYKDFKNMERTYSPDFRIDNKIIEVKPKKLWNTLENRLKFDAARDYFKTKGYTFEVVDVIPNSKELKEKYLNGEIKFVNKYIERFEKYAEII